AGVRRMTDVRDVQARKTALVDLFQPIAPSVHIVGDGEEVPDEPALHPAGATSLDVVAWEHKGFGDSGITGVYASKRRHRQRTAPLEGFPYGALWQAVDALPYRGARVRLRGKLRTRSPGRGQLWIR